MMWALVGFFCAGRHLVPQGVMPYSWEYHRPRLTEAEVERLNRTTDGYYFALCGVVCVRPTEGLHPWDHWALCTACATRGRTDPPSHPGPGNADWPGVMGSTVPPGPVDPFRVEHSIEDRGTNGRDEQSRHHVPDLARRGTEG